MKKITLPLAAIAALAFVALDSSPAQAQLGIYIGGRGAQIGIGSPYRVGYGYRGYTTAYHPSARAAYRGQYSRTHYKWHDTSHWDYLPGQWVPHGDHCDYVPPRRVWHEDGHWDRHRGNHHGRRH